jgi:hypothetical protein
MSPRSASTYNRLAAALSALTAALLFLAAPAVAAPANGAPWLLVSDVHYTGAGGDEIARSGADTNAALLESALAEMKRVDPDPPVVIIPGDFVGHHLQRPHADQLIADVARRFDRTFPHAQFVIALGNNDTACGDYKTAWGEPFLAAAARAWAPLVNRAGTAPSFERDFPVDGGYEAELPVPHLRAVVVDDVFSSVRYADRCHAGGPEDPWTAVLDRFSRRLRDVPPDERTWVIMHIPPGIDAYSTTRFTHRLLIVPFLRSDQRAQLVDVLNDPRNRVALAIAGHTHHFGFRLTDFGSEHDVAVLGVPAISPIQRTAPSFLTMRVDEHGSVSDVLEYAYDGDAGWRAIGGLPSLGINDVTSDALAAALKRFPAEPALRDEFDYLYSGGARKQITGRYWREYWCAAREMTASGYGRCTAERGFSVVTARGLAVLAGAALAALVVVMLISRLFPRSPGKRR